MLVRHTARRDTLTMRRILRSITVSDAALRAIAPAPEPIERLTAKNKTPSRESVTAASDTLSGSRMANRSVREHVSKAIASRRFVLGWSQAELAAKVGVSRQAVGQWERGQTT